MDTNIFGGLDSLGVSGLEGLKLFEEENEGTEAIKEQEAIKANEPTPEEKEAAMLFDKTYECPICGRTHKESTVRTGKARLSGMDYDLRQKFEGIEPLKYDVISCTTCGFTAISKFYVPLTPGARKNVIEKITKNYKPQSELKGIISFEQAIGRYKLALANDVVRNAKNSEKAYTCLRAGWLCRSYKEKLIADGKANEDEEVVLATNLEMEFIKNAYEGFMAAVAKESYPMCGMDEGTVNYLLAALAISTKHYDVSAKLISTVIASPSSSPRMKDKARELKEKLVLEMKKQG